jgi:hypothetical protein
MSNFPFRDPVTRRKLSSYDVEELLRRFEDAWAEQHGERVTSATFYERHCAGEADSMLGMAWASYYEAYRRMGTDRTNAELIDRLLATG